jgi:hypothetical protein
MALNDAQALVLARDAYGASTTYFDSGIRTHVEAAMRQFRGEHPTGSKYRSDAYASRSKLFRPKTRAMVTKAEATAAEAFFATEDVVTITPWDESSQRGLVSADINRALLQYRLNGKHPKRCIPWYVTAIAAYQEAMVNGVVCSRQWWEFDKPRGLDRPRCDLVPIENIRFDAAANWADPVNYSPYWIELVPMYVKDVKAKAADPNPYKKWVALTDGEILAGINQRFDSTRQAREGSSRPDPKDQVTAITEYTLVWVHRNIVEWNGRDYFYYTLGTDKLLSKVVPLEQEFWHGRRPYVMGYTAIEAHRNYPTSPVMQAKDLQAEANDVVNLRLDNVKFVLSKRYFVRRNAQVDLRSLTRNTIGSATLMKDPQKDVKVVDFNDVTGSAYQEQDRINVDMDEIGGFSSSSVQTNRKLGETVGGMNLLAAEGSQTGNYRLRTFVETWMEPATNQLCLLEQKYETDEVVMAIAGKRSVMYQRFGESQALDHFLNEELVLSVNVGFGPTNPTFQLERFMQAMTKFKEILADAVLQNAGINVEEVKKEIFGKLGYRDGRRFFHDTENPEVKALMDQIAALEQQLAQKESPEERAAKVRKLNVEADKIIAETEKVRQEIAQMGQGENPEVAALNQQLTGAQQDWQEKEREYAAELDSLEMRLADKSETADAQARTEQAKQAAETERARIDADAKVRIAEIDRERAAELAKFEKVLTGIQEQIKALAKKVSAKAPANG